MRVIGNVFKLVGLLTVAMLFSNAFQEREVPFLLQAFFMFLLGFVWSVTFPLRFKQEVNNDK